MRASLIDHGFTDCSDRRFADIYIVNSCTVTHKADRDVRRLVRHFHAVNPKADIVVAGCYVETDRDKRVLSTIDGVTLLVSNRDKSRIAQILKASSGKVDSTVQIKRHEGYDRAFLKVQDGCNNYCSYCKVPIVRGRAVSRDEKDILREVKDLISMGFKEIVLTGICLGSWGTDLSGHFSLQRLVERIALLEGDFRIRLSSIEPQYVTTGLIKAVSKASKICRHLHIPVQSGDDTILARMNRKYTTKRFSDMIAKTRKLIPDVAFSTDIIVGFPGENKNTFRNTYRLVEHLEPSRVHIFSYSKREGTRAFSFSDEPAHQDVKIWVKRLEKRAQELALRYARAFKGKNVSVLVESNRDKKTGFLTGYTDSYIRVVIDGPDELINRIIPVKVVKVSKGSIFGRYV